MEAATALKRFRQLDARLRAGGGGLGAGAALAWARAGIACGAFGRVERQLRAWLAHSPAHPERARWLWLLATVRWRRRDLPAAVEGFRAALQALVEAGVADRPALREPAPPRFDPSQGERLLWNALAALAASGVGAFATAGTLLGLQREGGLLAHDKDLDIGVGSAQFETADEVLRGLGWDAMQTGLRFSNVLSYLDRASGMALDLLAFTHEAGSGKLLGGFWLHGVPWEWQRVLEYPDPGQMRRHDSPAGPVWALAEPDAWLTALYGDWRTPDPGFETVISARNLRGFALLTQCYAYSRIGQRWLGGSPARAASLVRQVIARHAPDDPLLARALAVLEPAGVAR